jgi:MFS family permease
MKEFHCNEEIFLLGLTFFILGFGTSPLVFAPLSESFGRRHILVACMVFYTI